MDAEFKSLVEKKIATNEMIKNVCESTEFWLAKGQEALKNFQEISIEESVLEELIKLIDTDNGFNKIKESSDPAVVELREAMFTVIAYCDTKPYIDRLPAKHKYGLCWIPHRRLRIPSAFYIIL